MSTWAPPAASTQGLSLLMTWPGLLQLQPVIRRQQMRQQAPVECCVLQVPAPCRHIILFLPLQAGLQSGPNPAATLRDVKDRLRGIMQQTQAADGVDHGLVENLKALQQLLQSDQQLSALSGSVALLRAQEELGSIIQQFQGDVDSGCGQESREPGIERLDRLAESLAMPGSLPHHTGGQEGGATLLHLQGPHLKFARLALPVSLWLGSELLAQVAGCIHSVPD